MLHFATEIPVVDHRVTFIVVGKVIYILAGETPSLEAIVKAMIWRMCSYAYESKRQVIVIYQSRMDFAIFYYSM